VHKENVMLRNTEHRPIGILARRLMPASLTIVLLSLHLLPGAFAAEVTAQDASVAGQDITDTDPLAAAKREAELITGVRQLTFEGRRAGEGYFGNDGSLMVFQSERERDNPFFQIYLMDLETGDIERISPGHGKTTCSWIHPGGNQVLFASTHDDPHARKKQAEEIRLRESGRQRRYSWDYDEHYEIYTYDRRAKRYTNLTNVRGYDAEGSFSPDGRLIAFASNRRAYDEQLSADEQKMFEHDPATMIDIYVCNADGTNVRRLTSEPGYDGGPFFSPDGKRICWRHFTTNGAIAEIMTMNIDGADKRQLTKMGAMSWAPFYHPSGQYLIFTTNLHGFSNFELYLIDTAGRSRPVRASYCRGFDGLPVFSPDGKRLAWTSNRTSTQQSQIFIADWDHQRALQLLGLDRRTVAEAGDAAPAARAAREAGAGVSQQTVPDYSPQDVRRHVEYLCGPNLAGRLTGTEGERLATAYVAGYFEALGLEPAGDDGTWFDNFEFTANARLAGENKLVWGDKHYQVDKLWRPVSFSRTGEVEAAPVVFAGYGISAPRTKQTETYDSYVHLDAADKWVLVFRYQPENVPHTMRQQLTRHASLRYKAMVARDKGARGLILVSGPNSQVKSELIPLWQEGSQFGSSLPIISVTDEVAQQWLNPSGKKLKQLQDKLDTGEQMLGFELQDVTLAARIELEHVQRQGRNVLARIPADSNPSGQAVVIGAHVDHLGSGTTDSLARDTDTEKIHFGADDNASGVAALLEIAEYLSDLKARGKLNLNRDILCAAWSGEELGTLGSSHFVRSLAENLPAGQDNSSTGVGPDKNARSIYPAVAACLNMDMVGRLRGKLILQGVASSSIWPGEIERRNVPVGLSIIPQEDCYLPTDAGVFYLRGVPILSAFTGPHSDYHTPRDTPDKLNYDGAANVARLMGLITRSLAMRDAAPDYVAQAPPKRGASRGHLRAYLGTIPDYAGSGVKGVTLSGVARNGPADKAGLKGGDVIVELAGRKIDNIYDYTYAIEGLKIGQAVKVVVQRGDRQIELDITPASRD
jgi:Tol biopolymer transport system component